MTLKDLAEIGAILSFVILIVFGIPILIHHGNIKEAFQPDFKPYDDHTISVKLDEVQFNTLITTLRGDVLITTFRGETNDTN